MISTDVMPVEDTRNGKHDSDGIVLNSNSISHTCGLSLVGDALAGSRVDLECFDTDSGRAVKCNQIGRDELAVSHLGDDNSVVYADFTSRLRSAVFAEIAAESESDFRWLDEKQNSSRAQDTPDDHRKAALNQVSRRHIDVWVQRGLLFDHAAVLPQSRTQPTLKRPALNGGYECAVLQGHGSTSSERKEDRPIPLYPGDSISLIPGNLFEMSLEAGLARSTSIPVLQEAVGNGPAEPSDELLIWADEIWQLHERQLDEHQQLIRLRDRLATLARQAGTTIDDL